MNLKRLWYSGDVCAGMFCVVKLKWCSVICACMPLSYDNAVFHGIMSCNKKCYDHTYFNTILEILNIIDHDCNNNLDYH